MPHARSTSHRRSALTRGIATALAIACAILAAVILAPTSPAQLNELHVESAEALICVGAVVAFGAALLSRAWARRSRTRG